ncbi:MAG TPA: hypothetical protein PLL88_02275 [Anaerolineaceae bacterium]|jgi:hypothetical protein|nr:hypothetical protein [Anaerolineaceae bacterium]
MDSRRPGCLSGIMKLFFLDRIYDWSQRRFGYKSGGCMGCGCGTILFIIFVYVLIRIIFGTDWLRIGF